MMMMIRRAGRYKVTSHDVTVTEHERARASDISVFGIISVPVNFFAAFQCQFSFSFKYINKCSKVKCIYYSTCQSSPNCSMFNNT